MISSPKILSWDEAAQLAEDCRERGGVVVTTNGCFDILHRGHVSYLSQSRELGDLLLIGINSDESVRKLKGPGRPLNNELDRAFVLASLRHVDGVCIFSDANPNSWLDCIKPQIHAKGGDYTPETMPEQKVLARWGGRIVVLPFVPGHSTTAILGSPKKT